MKKIFSIALLFCLFSSVSLAGEKISEEVAVLVARAYIVGAQYPVDGFINDEIYKASSVTESDYRFVVLDASGDCAMEVVISFDGSVDQEQTNQMCN